MIFGRAFLLFVDKFKSPPFKIIDISLAFYIVNYYITLAVKLPQSCHSKVTIPRHVL